MLWIAFAFVIAMMVGVLVPRKPLSLNLHAKAPPPPSPKDPFTPPSDYPED